MRTFCLLILIYRRRGLKKETHNETSPPNINNQDTTHTYCNVAEGMCCIMSTVSRSVSL